MNKLSENGRRLIASRTFLLSAYPFQCDHVLDELEILSPAWISQERFVGEVCDISTRWSSRTSSQYCGRERQNSIFRPDPLRGRVYPMIQKDNEFRTISRSPLINLPLFASVAAMFHIILRRFVRFNLHRVIISWGWNCGVRNASLFFRLNKNNYILY